MKIVVIEDEQLIAEDLIYILMTIGPDIEIVAHISSVQEGIEFFSTSPKFDLVFSDIQLGDGLSFELFKKYKFANPVIFCTAYDEYAIDAFKANGIDYILKPFSEKTIQKALNRYNDLKLSFSLQHQQFENSMDELSQKIGTVSSILIHHKDKIIPLNTQEIALCYIRNESVFLLLFNGDAFPINKSLDDLEQLLGNHFYRANRQFIVNRDAVKDITTFLSRKYLVNLKFEFKEDITVSKEKMTSFLKWLKNE